MLQLNRSFIARWIFLSSTPSLIIPRSDTATAAKIKAAIQAAYEEGQSKLKGNGKSVPALSAIKTPLRDGNLERPDDEAYKNAYFINANSATAPGIVDADRQPMLKRSEAYSGVYGNPDVDLNAICKQMGRSPDWMPGILLRAGGYETNFYKKD